MTAIHQQHIIHRDIKPENIIRRQNDQKLVLIDFGVSKQKVLSNPHFSTSGATGTIKFLPSGQRQGEALLVKVERCERCSSGTSYDFSLLNKR